MAKQLFERVSQKTTKLISMYAGNYFPFYHIIEYPRSGGTWIAHLISDYLQIPFPMHYMLPVAFQCVLHSHWSYSKKLDKVVYVIRDGRDVAVSMMFKAIKDYASNKTYFYKRFPSLFQSNEVDVKRNFSVYLKEWFDHPAGCRFSWPVHVKQWLNRPNAIIVKYEDFHRDSIFSLKNLLLTLGIDKNDDELIKMTVKKNLFAKQTKRQPGIEDKISNKRKGIIGDWKNYFNQEAAKIFLEKTDDLLIKLGYEKNNKWIDEINC